MANKPLKTITFPGLSDTYTVPQIDTTLAVPGKAADAKAVGDALATGYYPDLYAGGLTTDEGDTDRTPYTFRATPYQSDREQMEIDGVTVAWNQLVGTSDTSVTVTSGHKYYAVIGGTRSVGASTGVALSVTGGTDIVIDLTTMFGSTIADHIYSLEQSTAGSGVSFVRQFLTKDYYPYCAPTLKSVTGLVSHDTTGSNIWGGSALLDSFKAAGIYNFSYDDTTLTYGAAHISAKTILENFPFKEKTSYTFIITCKNSNNSAATNLRVWYTDGTYANIVMPSATANLKQTAVFTTSATRTVQRVVGINLSGTITLYYNESGVMEGAHTAADFMPYVKHTYALDSTLTLRGIMKLDGSNIYADGDVYAADGTVTRRYREVLVDGGVNGVSFIGEWGATSYGYAVHINSGLPNRGTGLSDKFLYSTNSYRDMPLMSFGGGSGASSTWTFILPSTVTSIAEANTWATNNPFYIIVPRNTPTTETADPYTTPQICAPDGTEEFVVTADTDGAEVPVGHTTFYHVDLKGRLEGLPNDFSTLIAPTEVTYKATRNYTTGSLFIIKNVLYKATANIANGGTITPGTNCTPTTLAEIISAL